MPRPQFSLKTLLWSMAVVAAFLGGMAIQRRLDVPTIKRTGGFLDELEIEDGSRWFRLPDE